MRVMIVDHDGKAEVKTINTPADVFGSVHVEEKPLSNKRITMLRGYAVPMKVPLNKAITHRVFRGKAVFSLSDKVGKYTDITEMAICEIKKAYPEIKFTEEDVKCIKTSVSWLASLKKLVARFLTEKK